MAFKVTAFMCVYNEADILPWTLRHLLDQGISVHVIDNWSTDNSAHCVFDAMQCSRAVQYELFPASSPSPYYSWRPLLHRVEQLAAESGADWCIHHDADEIRRSPRSGETLLKAFERVDAEGYNVVNHKVYHFMPTDDDYKGDPERHFRYYMQDHDNTTDRHLKAWKNTGERVDLASSGGHIARFNGMKVSPELFVLKHYPMRTSEQAERKVLRERLARYDPAERDMRWHIQYDGLACTRDWIKDSRVLKKWPDDQGY